MSASSARSFVLAALVCLQVGCSRRPVRDPDPTPLARIQAEADLALPCAGKVTHFFETEPMDPTWVARVELPLSCAQKLSAIVAAKTADRSTIDQALWQSTSWWKPGKPIAQKRYYFNHPKGGASVFAVLAEENGQLVAYLERDLF